MAVPEVIVLAGRDRSVIDMSSLEVDVAKCPLYVVAEGRLIPPPIRDTDLEGFRALVAALRDMVAQVEARLQAREDAEQTGAPQPERRGV